MDDFVKQLSERLAGDPSRRGFLAKVGKITLGVAAVATGLDVTRKAEADALACCTGTACPSQGCPDGRDPGYTWSCGNYQCHDCYDKSGSYVCTYAEQGPQQASGGSGNGNGNAKKKGGGDGKGKKKGGGDGKGKKNGGGDGGGDGQGNGNGKKDGGGDGGKKKK